MNKEIEGLAKYVGEHVIARLDTIEKHKVKEMIVIKVEIWKDKDRRVNGNVDKV